MDDFELDDVLLMDFAGEFFNQGLRSSKHKTCFSFALGGPKDFNYVRQFWCGWVESGPNGRK